MIPPRPTPRIETARLVLRARTIDDADALHPAMADPEVMRFWTHAAHRDVVQTRADFARSDDAWRAWTITRRGDGAAIGFVAAGEARQGRVSEIGYMLARPHWGAGLAGEAVRAVLDQLLLAEEQRRVFADTDPDNRASRALLERLGFRLEGVLRGHWETHLGVRDTALYGLLAEEWRAVR